jgi:hypothetical protein
LVAWHVRDGNRVLKSLLINSETHTKKNQSNQSNQIKFTKSEVPLLQSHTCSQDRLICNDRVHNFKFAVSNWFFA